MDLAILFLVCFIASSIYPLASEGFVAGFIIAGYEPLLIFIIASIANTLGSLTTYGLGRLARINRKLNSILQKATTHPKAARFVNKYGFLAAFLCFLPFIGDIFALLLGIYGYHYWRAIIFIALGKAARYGILIYGINLAL